MAIGTRIQREASLLDDVGMVAPAGTIRTAQRKTMIAQYPFATDFTTAYGPTPRSGDGVILPVPGAGTASQAGS